MGEEKHPKYLDIVLVSNHRNAPNGVSLLLRQTDHMLTEEFYLRFYPAGSESETLGALVDRISETTANQLAAFLQPLMPDVHIKIRREP